ncbi:MAG: hypothetical protein ACXU98_01330, partial [Syntrophales bacterium]
MSKEVSIQHLTNVRSELTFKVEEASKDNGFPRNKGGTRGRDARSKSNCGKIGEKGHCTIRKFFGGCGGS